MDFWNRRNAAKRGREARYFPEEVVNADDDRRVFGSPLLEESSMSLNTEKITRQPARTAPSGSSAPISVSSTSSSSSSALGSLPPSASSSPAAAAAPASSSTAPPTAMLSPSAASRKSVTLQSNGVVVPSTPLGSSAKPHNSIFQKARDTLGSHKRSLHTTFVQYQATALSSGNDYQGHASLEDACNNYDSDLGDNDEFHTDAVLGTFPSADTDPRPAKQPPRSSLDHFVTGAAAREAHTAAATPAQAQAQTDLSAPSVVDPCQAVDRHRRNADADDEDDDIDTVARDFFASIHYTPASHRAPHTGSSVDDDDTTATATTTDIPTVAENSRHKNNSTTDNDTNGDNEETKDNSDTIAASKPTPVSVDDIIQTHREEAGSTEGSLESATIYNEPGYQISFAPNGEAQVSTLEDFLRNNSDPDAARRIILVANPSDDKRRKAMLPGETMAAIDERHGEQDNHNVDKDNDNNNNNHGSNNEQGNDRVFENGVIDKSDRRVDIAQPAKSLESFFPAETPTPVLADDEITWSRNSVAKQKQSEQQTTSPQPEPELQEQPSTPGGNSTVRKVPSKASQAMKNDAVQPTSRSGRHRSRDRVPNKHRSRSHSFDAATCAKDDSGRPNKHRRQPRSSIASTNTAPPMMESDDPDDPEQYTRTPTRSRRTRRSNDQESASSSRRRIRSSSLGPEAIGRRPGLSKAIDDGDALDGSTDHRHERQRSRGAARRRKSVDETPASTATTVTTGSDVTEIPKLRERRKPLGTKRRLLKGSSFSDVETKLNANEDDSSPNIDSPAVTPSTSDHKKLERKGSLTAKRGRRSHPPTRSDSTDSTKKPDAGVTPPSDTKELERKGLLRRGRRGSGSHVALDDDVPGSPASSERRRQPRTLRRQGSASGRRPRRGSGSHGPLSSDNDIPSSPATSERRPVSSRGLERKGSLSGRRPRRGSGSHGRLSSDEEVPNSLTTSERRPVSSRRMERRGSASGRQLRRGSGSQGPLSSDDDIPSSPATSERRPVSSRGLERKGSTSGRRHRRGSGSQGPLSLDGDGVPISPTSSERRHISDASERRARVASTRGYSSSSSIPATEDDAIYRTPTGGDRKRVTLERRGPRRRRGSGNHANVSGDGEEDPAEQRRSSVGSAMSLERKASVVRRGRRPVLSSSTNSNSNLSVTSADEDDDILDDEIIVERLRSNESGTVTPTSGRRRGTAARQHKPTKHDEKGNNIGNNVAAEESTAESGSAAASKNVQSDRVRPTRRGNLSNAQQARRTNSCEGSLINPRAPALMRKMSSRRTVAYGSASGAAPAANEDGRRNNGAVFNSTAENGASAPSHRRTTSRLQSRRKLQHDEETNLTENISSAHRRSLDGSALSSSSSAHRRSVDSTMLTSSSGHRRGSDRSRRKITQEDRRQSSRINELAQTNSSSSRQSSRYQGAARTSTPIAGGPRAMFRRAMSARLSTEGIGLQRLRLNNATNTSLQVTSTHGLRNSNDKLMLSPHQEIEGGKCIAEKRGIRGDSDSDVDSDEPNSDVEDHSSPIVMAPPQQQLPQNGVFVQETSNLDSILQDVKTQLQQAKEEKEAAAAKKAEVPELPTSRPFFQRMTSIRKILKSSSVQEQSIKVTK